MSKKGLIVVDLDKTLLDFDSFRYLTLQNIWNYKILYYTFLRKLRFLSAYDFKEKVMSFILKNKGEKYFEGFVDNLVNSIDKKVYNHVLNYQSEGDEILLLSASPKYYVDKIARNIKWASYGSTFKEIDKNMENLHLYGDEKVNYLTKNYLSETYQYKYAISDSLSDMKLLTLFEKYTLLNNGNFI
ncbi:MAG: hypothetical protein CSA95_04345 [Bacteroidetes bacterium]|nr:MAG: hypothetical protein CSA95_04345 [Bacteroidota bacterium]